MFYHVNSVPAYYCMSLLSPVSISVANTAKRTLMVALSIWYFGIAESMVSASGVVVVVVAGVFLYNHARLSYPPKTGDFDASTSTQRKYPI